MKLKAKLLDLLAGRPIVLINREDAEELGIKISGRVRVNYKSNYFVAIVNVSENIIKRGEIGIYKDIFSSLGIKENEVLEVEVAEDPLSTTYIKNKLSGRVLSKEEIYEIVKDVVNGNLTDTEITALVVSLNLHKITLEEAKNFALAMVETGKTLKLKSKLILDKHSIGGLSGDKTSLLLVPIIASLGYKIPKTSSRAITSAAGTADKASVLMNVSLTIEEMEKVVNKANGCLAWGGTLQLAPADDIFIKYEYQLGIDPFLLASIMAKKKAVGATHLVLDIPTGRGAKVKTIGDAEVLAKDFLELAKMLNIRATTLITQGLQPIGYSVGPALEAKEALEILMNRRNVNDVIDKVLAVASSLLNLVGVKNGREIAYKALKNGKAEKKMREIISLQGGNEKIKPEDINIANYYEDYIAEKDGLILWIDNSLINLTARMLGCPKDLTAGIHFFKKVNDKVRRGEKILRVYSNSTNKIERALKFLKENFAVGIGKNYEILIKSLTQVNLPKKFFVLER